MVTAKQRLHSEDLFADASYEHQNADAMIDRITADAPQTRVRVRSRRRLSMVVLPATLVAGLVTAGVLVSDAASPPPPPNANTLPPKLPESAGLSPNAQGWTLVSTGSSRIWNGRGYSPVDSRALGLTGGLGQFWIATSVADKYGTGLSLPLPIPLPFAQAHPGPIEATDIVLSFSKASSPVQLRRQRVGVWRRRRRCGV